MGWREFERRRRDRRARALDAADLLKTGDRAAAHEMLHGWDLGPYLPAAQQTLDELLRDPPAIPQGEAAAELAEALEPPSEGLGDTDDDHVHRALALARLVDTEFGSVDRVAWCLARLAGLADDVQQRHHVAWRNHHYACHDLDDEVRQMWRSWMEGSPWSIRQRWHELFFDRAAAAFRSEIPNEVPTDNILRDLEEAFFYGMLGGPSADSGWTELANRVLETCGEEPVTGLAAYAGDGVWRLAAQCVVQRGHLRRTAQLAWPQAGNDLGRAWRAHAELPRHWGSFVNLHVLIRVCERWKGGTVKSEATWNSIAQNRGRARGRMRAAMRAAGPREGWHVLLGVDALYARTRDAIGWMCLDWARAQRHKRFTFDLDQTPAGAPCRPDGIWRAPLDEEGMRILRTWAVLVATKQRIEYLLEWAQTGSHRDRDSTFGRLLRDLPEVLLGDTSDRYGLVRATVCARWVTAIEPVVVERIETVATLDGGSTLPNALRQCLDGWWHPAIARPEKQPRKFWKTCSELANGWKNQREGGSK